MKKHKLLPLIFLVLCLVTLALELLPFGAVLNFIGDEGQVWVRRYSYFNLTPYGYAHMSPFFTALLTCILTALAIAELVTDNATVQKVIRWLAPVTLAMSLCPLLLGLRFYSIVGALISATLALATVIAFFIRPNPNEVK
ncbi:MAG: hypothetical protein IKA82_03530 [Clostridia bacterium]|nr:hypothetical protein [Clostridia bacterium]